MNFNIFFTNSCNLECRYCYEGDKKKKNISLDILDNTLEFIKNVTGNNNSISVTTHGGEPLLAFEEIQYFIKMAKQMFPDIRFNMTTNATLFTENKIEFMEKYYDQVAISIDGNQLAHNANRIFYDGSGSYEIVAENARKILDKGMRLQARMTVNPYNYMHVSEGICHLIDMGFVEILPIPDIFSKEWTDSMLSELNCDLKKIVKYLKENKSYSDISVGLIDTVKCKMKNSSCDGGITTFTINTDGKIYPCILCNDNTKYCIGTVEDGIDDDRLKYIHRLDQQYVEKCVGCTRYDYCTNTRCKLINEIIEGDANAPIPVQCQIENIVVELNEYADSLI